MNEKDLARFTEYLSGAIARRRKERAGRLMKSRTTFFVVRHLYEAAGKSELDLEMLINARDRDTGETVRYNLTKLNITNFEALRKWAGQVDVLSSSLAKLETGGRQSLTDDEFKALVSLKERKPAPQLLSVMWRFAQKCNEAFTAKPLLLDMLAIVHPNDIDPLYRMLLLTLAPKIRRESKRENRTDTPELTEDAKKLAEQNEELKTELESLYIRLNASEESLERSRQEGAELAVIDVLARMNSQEAGMLIDQFAKAEQTLKQLSSSGYKIPNELASVPLCVRMFMQTMRNVFMISPIHKMGETLSLTFEDSGKYDYSGSDFEDSDEAKTVKVLSPGWKCGDEVFSMPKVIEVSSNAD